MHSLIASRLLEYSSTDQQCLNFVELYMKVKMFMQCLSPPNVFCGVCVPGIERLIDQIRRLGLPPAPPSRPPATFLFRKQPIAIVLGGQIGILKPTKDLIELQIDKHLILD